MFGSTRATLRRSAASLAREINVGAARSRAPAIESLAAALHFKPKAFDPSRSARAAHPTETDPEHSSLVLRDIDPALLGAVELLLAPGGCKDGRTFVEFRARTPHVHGRSVRWLLGLGNGRSDQRPKQLDDELVNGYLSGLVAASGEHVRQRVVIFSALFWSGVFGRTEQLPLDRACGDRVWRSVHRLPDRDELLDKELIIFPINSCAATHWMAGCIDLGCCRFGIYDSLGGHDGQMQLERMRFVFQILHLHLRGARCGLDDWTDVSWSPAVHIPKQVDNYNCGLFMLYTISSLARGVPIQLGLEAALATWPSSFIIRKRVLCELLAGKLLL